jgi:hypothetical protein
LALLEINTDRMAQQVMQRLNAPQIESPPDSTLQRETLPEEDEKLQINPMVQRSSLNNVMPASEELESAIASNWSRPL